MMDEKIDVLAVMDEAEGALRHYSNWEQEGEITFLADRLNSATKSVIELIEAATEEMLRFEFIHGGYCSRLRSAIDQFGATK
jgi:hypothetical protein